MGCAVFAGILNQIIMTSNNNNKSSRLTVPVSVRLTCEERDQLRRAAGRLSISEYIRTRLFCDVVQTSIEGGRLSPQERQRLLAQILIGLGQSGLASNLAELADAAHLGLLDLPPEVHSLLAELLGEVRGLRQDLLKALGLRGRKDDR